MRPEIAAILGLIAGPLISALIIAFLPRKRVYNFGYFCGKKASTWLRQKIGKQAEKRIESTLFDFTSGLIDGLKSNNVN